MKKTLLTLGSIASVATPIIAVVSCGDNDTKTENVVSISAYNMKSINDMGDDKAKLTTLIVDANKEKTYNDFKTLVDATDMSDANKLMINNIMKHYENTTNHKVTRGWYVLKFAIATIDPVQLMLAGMGWVDEDEDGNPLDQQGKADAVKKYILAGTLDTKEMAKSIIDKFAGRDGTHFNNTVVMGALVINESEHKLVKGATAGFALQAMGGEETLEFILKDGTGQTWTIEDAPAANPAA